LTGAVEKSKIEELRKSRESRIFDVFTAARLCRTDSAVRGRFGVNDMVSTSRRAERASSPEEFSRSIKEDFFDSIDPERTSRSFGQNQDFRHCQFHNGHIARQDGKISSV